MLRFHVFSSFYGLCLVWRAKAALYSSVLVKRKEKKGFIVHRKWVRKIFVWGTAPGSKTDF